MPSALITVAFPVQPTRALALSVHGFQVHSAAAWASDSHLSPTLWAWFRCVLVLITACVVV